MYLICYKASCLFRSIAMWKVIKMNKKFCKSTSMVLAEVCKALKTNPRVYFSGKKILLILMGNWCIIFWEISLRVIPNYHHKQQHWQKESISKFSKETKQIKLAREILMSMLHFFFLSLLKITAKRVESQRQHGKKYMKKTFLKKVIKCRIY